MVQRYAEVQPRVTTANMIVSQRLVAIRTNQYDNSVENALPQLLFRTVDGEVFRQYTEDLPE